MSGTIPRRGFIGQGLGLGAGALLLPRLGRFPRKAARSPILVTSHANQTGQDAARIGWEILSAGGRAVDAIEAAANHVEDDPEDMSVGYGGAPNADGVVQLDSSFMDGRSYSAGAVASLENIRHPSSVARVVMEHTDHVLMVGPGALEFAKMWGFEEEDLLTEKARKAWLTWRENLNANDPWGPPSHLRGIQEPPPGAFYETYDSEAWQHGTVNVLAIDAEGHLAGSTTTSGWAWKIPGRVGDSPIIGAGLYVDGEVGAAGAVGRGEDAIKACASYHIVMRMREGRSPQDACMDTLQMIVERYRRVNPAFFPGEHFVAISKDGEVGCATMSGKAHLTVIDVEGLRVIEGPGLRG